MLISLIVPVYNKVHYISSTLDAIQSQTFRDFECLLIDDGSTDGSGKVCDEFAESDHRFRVFHIQNGGVSHARNVGLDCAQGEYITFVDGDDEIHPDYLANLYSCIAKSGADLVIGCVEKVWAGSDLRKPMLMPHHGMVQQSEILANFAEIQKMTGLYGCCVAKLFRGELSNGIRFDETLQLAEDFDFYLRLYPKVRTIYFDDKPCYYYLQAAENSSALVSSDAIDYIAQLRINLHYRDFLRKMGAYTGENQKILEETLKNYLYFSIFHCPIAQFSERFLQLRAICEEENLTPHGENALQKWLLFWLRKGTCFIPKCTMRLYRSARRLLR
ncbi:MAG: glycosyltransferase family 2 protein [Oscillospiraceae bacterium]